MNLLLLLCNDAKSQNHMNLRRKKKLNMKTKHTHVKLIEIFVVSLSLAFSIDIWIIWQSNIQNKVQNENDIFAFYLFLTHNRMLFFFSFSFVIYGVLSLRYISKHEFCTVFFPLLKCLWMQQNVENDFNISNYFILLKFLMFLSFF